MNIRKHIPNAITCLSLVSGCIAIVMALSGMLLAAVVWILIAAVLDFLDGFAARMLHAYSAIGKDLDSLSDVISFGVAPGMILFYTLQTAVPFLPSPEFAVYIPYLAFVIPAFSALRLAKFNNDERQTTSFIGMPVPAHALLWCSIGYSVQPLMPVYPVAASISLVIGAVLTSLLLVSEIPMFSLKIKSLAWKGNEVRYILVAAAILFCIFFGIPGIAGTIVLYILLSWLTSLSSPK
ncbi:MAG: CDP-diacylglycerol--serine O-phosphatidyltransferase [Tannerellaceae bacterium]|nr:CDP-diacylglycerol--serine O-phosphatidyltransferase [Tannerellaceae bacterium]